MISNCIRAAFFMLSLLNAHALFSQDSLITRIDKLLSAELKSDMPGGVVLVSKDSKILYKKAFGMADMELNVPMQDSMVFYIASNTKQFTAVAILQLLEKGKLTLKDSLGKFLVSPLPAAAITVEQLLSHTSGLSGKDDAVPDRSVASDSSYREMQARRYASLPLDFPPGSKWSYNNANFQLLGYIIEKITGLTYEDYINKNIFMPAGMQSSFLANDSRLIRNRASGYLRGRNGLVNVPLHHTGDFYASGGVLSTVTDMYKWNEALKAGILVRRETLTKAFISQKLTDGKQANYGFGWHLENLRGSPTHRHGGAVPGFISETLYLPAEDVFVVMMLNSESPVPSTVLTRIIASFVIDKPYSFLEIKLEDKALKSYPGVYQNDKEELINITGADGKIYFQRPGGRRYHIRPSAADQFFFDKDYLWVEFQQDSAKAINGLWFSRAGVGVNFWRKTDRPVLDLK